jgi:hypothetical protein
MFVAIARFPGRLPASVPSSWLPAAAAAEPDLRSTPARSTVLSPPGGVFSGMMGDVVDLTRAGPSRVVRGADQRPDHVRGDEEHRSEGR